HSVRVGYIMAKILEGRGSYEKYEIADFMILAMLHDIGAYKTDDVRKQLTYEAKRTLPHSIYGYLFLKYLSPFEERSKIILYHHMDYTKTKELDYRYRFELEVLKIAEMMDIWYKAFGDKFEYSMINKYSGTKFDPEVVALLDEVIKEDDFLEKIRNNTFGEEVDEYEDYVLLSDNEKEKYLKMLMYCTGLRDEEMVSETISVISVSRELVRKMNMNENDKNEVYYAALLHDIGMLAIPSQLLNAPRNLNEEEKNLIKTHVEIMEKMLEGKISENIIKIAAAHHERFDGSGYPKGLKASFMTNKDAILQISEYVVNAMKEKPYRRAYTKKEIIDNLNNGIITGRYEAIVTDTFMKYYDDIIEIAEDKADMAMVMYQKLLRNYKQVYNSLA
ncbi:MAG: HD domain-containing protein, partial [Lachnospiraceae bacterium]|nr:HD domain-containing protein [Lachnospiraceae bacterium]